MMHFYSTSLQTIYWSPQPLEKLSSQNYGSFSRLVLIRVQLQFPQVLVLTFPEFTEVDEKAVALHLQLGNKLVGTVLGAPPLGHPVLG